ncbi:MAG: GntR family transcriptional regulator [Devosia sp.]
MTDFDETQPIFLQIRQRLAEMILSGAVTEGEALPSVRSIAADLAVNPLTVTRAYNALVALGVVESRRGMGMFVAGGARDRLRQHEQDTFLNQEWPRIRARVAALGLDLKTLLKEPR